MDGGRVQPVKTGPGTGCAAWMPAGGHYCDESEELYRRWVGGVHRWWDRAECLRTRAVTRCGQQPQRRRNTSTERALETVLLLLRE